MPGRPLERKTNILRRSYNISPAGGRGSACLAPTLRAVPSHQHELTHSFRRRHATSPHNIHTTPHASLGSGTEQDRLVAAQHPPNPILTCEQRERSGEELLPRMMQIAIIRSHPLRAPISRACLEPAEQRWPAEGEEAFASSRPLFVVFQAGEVCATVARSKAGIRVFVLPRPSRGPDWRARARRQPLR